MAFKRILNIHPAESILIIAVGKTVDCKYFSRLPCAQGSETKMDDHGINRRCSSHLVDICAQPPSQLKRLKMGFRLGVLA